MSFSLILSYTKYWKYFIKIASSPEIDNAHPDMRLHKVEHNAALINRL